jgi:hypothetical protein
MGEEPLVGGQPDLTLCLLGSTFSPEGKVHRPLSAGEGQGMKHRFAIAIPIAMLAALVIVSPAGAQRGMGARPAPVNRAALGGSFRMGGRGAFRPAHPLRPIFRGRGGARGWIPGWGYLPYPDSYGYSDDEPATTEAPPWESAAEPAQAAPPVR